MSNQVLARNIKDLMHARDIRSAAELARRAGVKEGLIRFYLRGESKHPSQENSRLQAIAAALGTTTDALLAPGMERPSGFADPQKLLRDAVKVLHPDYKPPVSAAQQVLRNVMFDVGEQAMTDEEATQMALAIQEALRQLKK